MTERFSKEYIEFVTKSERIQKLWKPRVGDWCLSKGDVLCLITGTTTHETEIVLVSHMGFGGRASGYSWLPTLDDLVELLVASHSLGKFRLDRFDEMWVVVAWPHRYVCSCRDCQIEISEMTRRNKDLKLAVAQVLDKVLEKENDETDN